MNYESEKKLKSGSNLNLALTLCEDELIWWISIGFGFNFEATFVKEEDIATYTIKAVDDPRTLNKVMYMRPHANTLSFNELVSLWEKKIGKTLERTYLLEDQVLKNIKG